jgi:two-component system phosphate regulon sensor histidine kinase PhoR
MFQSMFTSPFFRRLFVPYLLLICGAIATVGFLAARVVRGSYLERQTESLRDGVRLVSAAIAPEILGREPPADLDAKIDRLGAATGLRITIMREDGVVVADSEADLAGLENHKARPEFVRAANSGEGITDRTSGTVHAELLYLAQRLVDPAGAVVKDAGGRTYFTRMSVHLDELRHDLRALYGALAVAGVACVLMAGAICYVFARRQTEPISELTAFADALSRGDLHRRTARPEKGEIATLALSLNMMAESLSRLVSQANKDKAELLTILSSMSEGVIATDIRQRILMVNEAAGKLMGFDANQALGRRLFEVVRNEEILKAAGEVLTRSEQRLISVGPVSARHLDVTLSTFPTDGKAQGLVLVAHDITQSFQYQELRKEFVANVSHELRTPLTVIKGFVETLLDGAWRDDKKSPEYLGTILKHADQLTNLVSDLLELSKLEGQGLPAQRSPVDLKDVVQRAYELLLPATERKRQTIKLDVAPKLPQIRGNADYVERAVANLIDNASKYTPEGGHIAVRAHGNGQFAVVEVADDGIGIPADDIPRIFERFYRVDRSRSREMGGTGLGLSIVKHVAQVHGGTIEVDSTPGKGSVFRLKLPAG